MLMKMVNGVEVEMSPEEEAGIRADWAALTPSPNDAINAQIAAIEAATGAVRVVREGLLRYAERFAQDDATAWNAANPTLPQKTSADMLATNYGYQKTLAVDNKIAALRSQLQ
jgi:hypothetical protein